MSGIFCESPSRRISLPMLRRTRSLHDSVVSLDLHFCPRPRRESPLRVIFMHKCLFSDALARFMEKPVWRTHSDPISNAEVFAD